MTIHLAIAFDKNYLAPFYALITSIFESNRGNKLEIHSIVSGVSDEEKNAIRSFVEANTSNIHYYTIDEATVSKFVLTSKWTSAVYYRLYFPFLVPGSVSKLLYLDTDTLVLNDLKELYTMDLQHYPVGAVYDNWVKTAPQLGIHNENEYFNSGVLIIDVDKWKQERISEQAFDYLTSYPDRIKFVDQDALNAVLFNNWKKLDCRFNTLYSYIPQGVSQKELQDFLKGKVVLHFTLQRPWHYLNKNPYQALYRYFLKKSPGHNLQVYTDFTFLKVPRRLQLSLIQLYYNWPAGQTIWRKAKKVFT